MAQNDSPQLTNEDLKVALKYVLPTMLVLGFVAMLFVLSACTSGSGPTESAPVDTDLNGRAQFTGDGVSFTNLDAIEWRGCELTLNSGTFGGGGWTYKPGPVAAGATISAPYGSFTKGDGSRFSVLTTQPQSIAASCLDAGGTAKSAYFGRSN